MSREIPAAIATRWTLPNLKPGVHASHLWGPARLFDTQGMDHLIRVMPKHLLMVCELGDGWVFTLHEHKRWFRRNLKPRLLSSRLREGSEPLWGFITASATRNDILDMSIYTFAKSKSGVGSAQAVADRIAEAATGSYEAWKEAQPEADDLPTGLIARTVPIQRTDEPCKSVLHLDGEGGIELVSDTRMKKVKKKARAQARQVRLDDPAL